MSVRTSSQEWQGSDSRQASATPLKTYQEMMVKSMLGELVAMYWESMFRKYVQ